MFADISIFLDPTLSRGLKLAHGRERLQKYLYLYHYHYYFEGAEKLKRTEKITKNKRTNQKSEQSDERANI